jgi:hypothetical protein
MALRPLFDHFGLNATPAANMSVAVGPTAEVARSDCRIDLPDGQQR